MTAEEAAQAYGEAILRALDQIATDDRVFPAFRLEFCLAMQAALGPVLQSPELRNPAAALLAQLGERAREAQQTAHERSSAAMRNWKPHPPGE